MKKEGKESNQLKDIGNVIQQYNTSILDSYSIKAQINEKKIQSYFLVNTPIGFFLISQPKLMKKPEVNLFVSLFDIIGFDFINNTQLICHYKIQNSILIEITNYRRFIQTIVDQHYQLLIGSSLYKSFIFKNFPIPIQPSSELSPISNEVTLRYISMCAKYQQSIDPETMNIFEKFQRTDRFFITFTSKCKSVNNYHIISNILIHEPFLRCVKFDFYSPQIVCKIIYSLLKHNKNIQIITIRNYNELNFEQLGFDKLTNPSVVSWNFSNLMLSNDRIPSFFDGFSHYQGDLLRLTIEHFHFSYNYAKSICKSISEGYCFRTLEVLNMNYIDCSRQDIGELFLLIQNLVSQLHSLRAISFEYWMPSPLLKIDINGEYSLFGTNNIRYISLSLMDLKTITTTIRLPKTLNCLLLDGCRFSAESLVNLLSTVRNAPFPFSLSLSQMMIDDSELNQFYNMVSKLSSFENLVELNFSNNQIPAKFVNEFCRLFITSNLRFLSLNNVFGPDQIDDLITILTACENHCHLWGLELIGGKIKTTLGPKLKSLFSIISRLEQLELLNISSQRFTSLIFNDLLNFIDSLNNLQYISIDDTGITNLSDFYKLYQHLFIKTRCFAIQKPYSDLNRLILSDTFEKEINDNDFLEFKNKIIQYMVQPTTFIRTFYYFKYPDMTRFPSFLSAFPISLIELPDYDRYGITSITSAMFPFRSLSDYDFQEIENTTIGNYQVSLLPSPLFNVPVNNNEIPQFEFPGAMKKYRGSYEYDPNLTRPEIIQKQQPRDIVHQYQSMINVANKPLFRSLVIIEDILDNITMRGEHDSGGDTNTSVAIEGTRNIMNKSNSFTIPDTRQANQSNLMKQLSKYPKIPLPQLVQPETYRIIAEQIENLADPGADLAAPNSSSILFSHGFSNNNDIPHSKSGINIGIQYSSFHTPKNRIKQSISPAKTTELSLANDSHSSSTSLGFTQNSKDGNEYEYKSQYLDNQTMKLNPFDLCAKLQGSSIELSISDPDLFAKIGHLFHHQKRVYFHSKRTPGNRYIDYSDDYSDFEYEDDDTNEITQSRRLPPVPSTKVLSSTKYGTPEELFDLNIYSEEHFTSTVSTYRDKNISIDINAIDDDDEQMELWEDMLNDEIQESTLKQLRILRKLFMQYTPKNFINIDKIPVDPLKIDPKMPNLYPSLQLYKNKYCSELMSIPKNFSTKNQYSNFYQTKQLFPSASLFPNSVISGPGQLSSLNLGMSFGSKSTTNLKSMDQPVSFQFPQLVKEGQKTVQNYPPSNNKTRMLPFGQPNKNLTPQGSSSNTLAQFQKARLTKSRASFSSGIGSLLGNADESDGSENDMMPDASTPYPVFAPVAKKNMIPPATKSPPCSAAFRQYFQNKRKLTSPGPYFADQPIKQETPIIHFPVQPIQNLNDSLPINGYHPNPQRQNSKVVKLNQAKPVVYSLHSESSLDDGDMPLLDTRNLNLNQIRSESGDIMLPEQKTGSSNENKSMSGISGEESSDLEIKEQTSRNNPIGFPMLTNHLKEESKVIKSDMHEYSSDGGEKSDDMEKTEELVQKLSFVYPEFAIADAKPKEQPKQDHFDNALLIQTSSESGETSDNMMLPTDYDAYLYSSNLEKKKQYSNYQENAIQNNANVSSSSGETSEDLTVSNNA